MASNGNYYFTIVDANGQVGAYNFLAIQNPVGSSKIIVVQSIKYSAYAVTATVVRASMQLLRASAISGGVVETNICSQDTSLPAATAVLRSTNPTATLDGRITCFPPPSFGSSGRVSAIGDYAMRAGEDIMLRPGEGLVFMKAAGDISETFNVGFNWSEWQG